jgi:hypothetical protein
VAQPVCERHRHSARPSHSGKNRKTITRSNGDETKFFSDVVSFAKNGAVYLARSLTNVPFPSGAPWERYKWFPEKARGAAVFPEWIWTDPANVDPVRCLSSTHAFHLGGAGGSGDAGILTSSVRVGGREGHILQELGHSVFAECLGEFSPNKDVLGVYHAVYDQQPTSPGGGIGAHAMRGCPGGGDPDPTGFYDCRNPEHYFLSLLVAYRLNGTGFRAKIQVATGPDKARLIGQYNWLRDHWYNRVEYKRGTAAPASFAEDVQCLRNECSLLPEPLADTTNNWLSNQALQLGKYRINRRESHRRSSRRATSVSRIHHWLSGLGEDFSADRMSSTAVTERLLSHDRPVRDGITESLHRTNSVKPVRPRRACQQIDGTWRHQHGTVPTAGSIPEPQARDGPE